MFNVYLKHEKIHSNIQNIKRKHLDLIMAFEYEGKTYKLIF